MAAGDLTDLQGRVQDRGSFNTADTGLTAAKITTFINAGLKQIASEHDWPWLFSSATISTVAGTSGYAVPAGWMRTDSISEPATGRVLQERQIEELDRMIWSDFPYLYSIYGDALVLKPIPDAVYTLTHRYVKTETALASGGDLPLIPTAFDEGVVEWATMLAFRFAKQYDKAEAAAAAYNAWLKTTQDIVRRGRRPLRIQVRPGSGF